MPNVRRIAKQDFAWEPGVDVTDVRQTKGLEFDEVVLLETTAASYPATPPAHGMRSTWGPRARPTSYGAWRATSRPRWSAERWSRSRARRRRRSEWLGVRLPEQGCQSNLEAFQ